MKKVWTILLVLAMLLGLSSTALAVTQEELLGIWNIDMASLMAMMGEDEDMEAMAPLLAMMTATMEFTADGTYKMTMSMMGQNDEQAGTYTVTADGKLCMDSGNPADVTIENDVMTITEDGMTMILNRSTGEAAPASEADQMAAFLALLASQAEEAQETVSAAQPAEGGKLEIVQENAHFVESYSNYEYVYAKVQNVGDREVKLNDCLLEVYDAAGEVLASKDYGDANAAYLKPGEYTYLVTYTDLEGTPDKYILNIEHKTDKYYTNARFPVTTDLQLNVEDGWRTRNFMYATVTNNADVPVYDMEVVLALLDAEGNVLYVEDKSLYDCSVVPGDSMIIRLEIPSDFMTYFENNNLVPASVDAIAFVELDQE